LFSASRFAASTDSADHRLQRVRSRIAQYREIADDEGWRRLQPERRYEIDEILNRAGDLVAVTECEQVLFVQAQIGGDVERARAVGRAALRINLAMKFIELLGRAQ